MIEIAATLFVIACLPALFFAGVWVFLGLSYVMLISLETIGLVKRQPQ